MHSANSPVEAAQKSVDARLVIVALGSSESACPELLDAAYKDAKGVFRGYFSGKTVFQLAKDYEHKGQTKLMRMAEFDKLHTEALRTAPVEITEAEWDEALNVLPPMKWQQLRGVESFRMSEFYSGTMTSIYAKCDGRYWTFRDDAYMDTADLVTKVRQAMQAEVSA